MSQQFHQFIKQAKDRPVTLFLIRVRRNHIERLQAVHQTPTVHISNRLWTNRLCMCLVIKRGKIEGTGDTSHELQIEVDPFKINPCHRQSKTNDYISKSIRVYIKCYIAYSTIVLIIQMLNYYMLFDHAADYTTAIVESLQKTMFESFPYWKNNWNQPPV